MQMAEETPKRLAAKMRKAREFEVNVGGFTFICARPTECEWYDKVAGAGSTERFMPFIVGWRGVKEMDVINNGEPHPLAFDSEVCKEWLSDRSDLYGPIIGAINKSFTDYAVRQAEDAKNSEPGSI